MTTGEPQQERSRRSARQILVAAMEVLNTGGLADFTMTEVSRSAGLSIGGVYGRFPNRESLLREVKDGVLSELEDLLRLRAREAGGSLPETLGVLIGTLAEALDVRAKLFSFVLLHSAGDPDMRRRGFLFHQRVKDIFRDTLAGHSASFARPAGPAVDVLYEAVVQSLIARTVIAGSLDEGEVAYPGVPDWRTYAEQLTEMTCLYLTTAPPGDDGRIGYSTIV